MWFLIKGTFWFTVVLLVLPFFVKDEQPAPEVADTKAVGVADTVTAASEALGYISGLCAEKPDVCVKGAETFTALGHRAREGARIAYELLDAQFGGSGDPVMTGTIAGPTPAAIAEASKPSELADAGIEAARDEEPLPFRHIPVPEWRLEPGRTSR